MSESTRPRVLGGEAAAGSDAAARRATPTGLHLDACGWTGGEGDSPTRGNPQGHAEAVEVVFDPEQLSYRDLLEWCLLGPILNPDLGEDLVGSSTRSETLILTDQQRTVAEETLR